MDAPRAAAPHREIVLLDNPLDFEPAWAFAQSAAATVSCSQA